MPCNCFQTAGFPLGWCFQQSCTYGEGPFDWREHPASGAGAGALLRAGTQKSPSVGTGPGPLWKLEEGAQSALVQGSKWGWKNLNGGPTCSSGRLWVVAGEVRGGLLPGWARLRGSGLR